MGCTIGWSSSGRIETLTLGWSTMAGRVQAHLVVSRDGHCWDIQPTVCPVADDQRRAAGESDAQLKPRCQEFNHGYGRRTCPLWYATTGEGNAAERLDGSILWERAIRDGKGQIRCGVLCLGARRNRPPGI